jgi:hypothetical protein
MLKLEAIGYRDTAERFARRTDELQARQREAVRSITKGITESIRHYAPKRTGVFAAGLGYRTDEKAGGTSGTVFVGGEHAFLLPMLIEGTRAHPIYPRGPYPLRFFWERGPRGPGIYYYMHVEHPGTIPLSFVADGIAAMEPQIEIELGRVARRVAWLS